MTRDAMRAVVERHVAAENRRDLTGEMATYADECFYDSVGLGVRFEGRDAVAAQYAALFLHIPWRLMAGERLVFDLPVLEVELD